MNEKPVVFITDDNFTIPTLVAVSSLLKNKGPDTCYKIFIVDVNLSQTNIEKLKKFILFKDTSIEIVKPVNEYKNIDYRHPFVSIAALFKFDIPLIFKDYEEILYIDSDTLIFNDLSEIFDIELENAYAAVVKDMIGYVKNKDNIKLGIKNYFNAGVMYLNLKKIREENLTPKLIETRLNSDASFGDQEIFNIIFKDNIKYLHPNFNYMSTNSLFSKKSIKNFYEVDEINPVILHLTDFVKPWIYKNAPYAKNWFEYYKTLPCKEETLQLKKTPKKPWKQKIGTRWCINIGLFRLSYLKGPKDFKLKLKTTENYDYFLKP